MIRSDEINILLNIEHNTATISIEIILFSRTQGRRIPATPTCDRRFCWKYNPDFEALRCYFILSVRRCVIEDA